MKPITIALCLFVLNGCAPSPMPDTHPPDMTAEQHRQEAVKAEAEAKRHEEHGQLMTGHNESMSTLHTSHVFTHEQHAELDPLVHEINKLLEADEIQTDLLEKLYDSICKIVTPSESQSPALAC